MRAEMLHMRLTRHRMHSGVLAAAEWRVKGDLWFFVLTVTEVL